MNNKLTPIADDDGSVRAYMFYCPGCKHHHLFNVKGDRPRWEYNHNIDKPTVTPSLLNRVPCDHLEPHIPEKVCHLYLTDGIIHFLPDCTHELAGKSVPLEEDI